MFKSKRLRKMAAKLMAVTMCAALIGTTAPITATENDTVLLNANFEPISESVLTKDFEDGNCKTTKFEGSYTPVAEIKTDENNNKYARIDATRYVWYKDGQVYKDNVNGGYLFDDNKKIANGNWTISFDFNVPEQEVKHERLSVSLAKTGLNANEGTDEDVYNQFRLLGMALADGGPHPTIINVNKNALEGDQPELNHWYHYKMKLNKTANTYTVEITDTKDATFKATQSGSVSQTYAFEGLMIGAGMIVNMDNISITGEKINAPEFVKKVPDTQNDNITYEISDDTAHIKNVGDYRYGAFMFKNAMNTSGKYEIKFDFNAKDINSLGAVYLADSTYGGSIEYEAFQLLGLRKGNFVAGNYIRDGYQDLTVPILPADLTGDDKDKWFTYEMVGDRTTGEWTATITSKTDASRTNTKSGSGSSGFPTDKAIDRMMFGTKCDIYVDNILVQESLTKPSMSDDRVKFLDKNGVQINCSNADVSLLTKKISLDFGTRMKEGTFAQNITLTKKDGTAVDFYSETSGTSVILKDLALDPTTEYTLTVKSDIAGKDGQTLGKDYTLNLKTGANASEMSLNSVKIGDTKVENFAGLINGNATVVIDSINTTTKQNDAVLIIAYYDGGNRLLLADAQNVSGAAESSAAVNAAVTIAKPEGCAKVKVMLWNSLGKTEPLSAILSY